MADQPVLTPEEWRLLVELLQQELDELPTEIHHTDSFELRQSLQERRKKLETLIGKIGLHVS